VARAAAHAGLQFIVLTDHGDGTRPPDPPRFVAGVLVIDAVELSTQRGHYIAIGMAQAPYPLRGEPREVVEDVRRLGGFGVVAHPDSARVGLRWHDWDAEVDAIEWLNADTEWRDEGTTHLARALVRYPLRPSETLGSLLDRPEATLTRWDRLTQQRPVVALAGADAHARAGWRDDDANGYRRSWFVRFPSYVASFRTFSLRVFSVRPIEPATDAAGAAHEILAALRAGRVYTAIDAIAGPAAFDMSLEREDTIVVRTNAAGGTIVLRRNGDIAAQRHGSELTFDTKGSPGTYRAEVLVDGAPGDPPVPWIVGNPIYVHPDGWGGRSESAPQTPTSSRGIQGGPWHVEKDDASTASVAQPDYPKGPVTFTFGLASGERSGQYAALSISVGRALSEGDRIAFRAHASRPMRVSVQVRHPQTGARWQRSIYIETSPREIVVPFSEFRPVGSAATFDPSSTDTLLFVVDTVNTLPGTNGTVTIEDLRVGR
jgi:hypothetical protein